MMNPGNPTLDVASKGLLQTYFSSPLILQSLNQNKTKKQQ